MRYEEWSDQDLKDELKDLDSEGVLNGDWEIDFMSDCAFSPGKLTSKMRSKAIEIIRERR